MKLFLLTTVLALELSLSRKPAPTKVSPKVRAALKDVDRAFAKVGSHLRHAKHVTRQEPEKDDHMCDHVSPEEEPCCAEKNRDAQNACLDGEMAQGHFCDHNGPDEEPCCGKESREDQNACLEEKYGGKYEEKGEGEGEGQHHDIPSEAEVRRILRQEECTGLENEDAEHCAGLVDRIVDVCYPKCVGTMGPGQGEGHFCDHTGPDEEPCCAKESREDQNACLEEKHGKGHYCDSHGPDEEPCCAKESREDQNACLEEKHGKGHFCDSHGPDEEPCCAKESREDQNACLDEKHGGEKGPALLQKLRAIKVRSVQRQPEKGEGHFCDHTGPEEEPCCGEKNREDQNACLEGKYGEGHFCDHTGPEEEPCCGKQSREDQDKCLDEKFGEGHYCDTVSPEEEPCCAKESREDQYRCLDEKHGGGDSHHHEGGCGPEQCFEHCAMDVLVQEGVIDVGEVPTHADIEADTLGFECGIFGVHDDLDAGVRTYLDENGEPVSEEQQLCGQVVSCGIAACHQECVQKDTKSFHDAIDCFSCCVPFVFEKTDLMQVCANRVLPIDGGPIAADPGLVGDNAMPAECHEGAPGNDGPGGPHPCDDVLQGGGEGHFCDHHGPEEEPCCGKQSREDQDKCLEEKFSEGHYCDHTSPEEESCCAESDRDAQNACLEGKYGEKSLVVTNKTKVQRFVLAHRAQLAAAGRILRGKHGERQWLIKRGAAAFRLTQTKKATKAKKAKGDDDEVEYTQEQVADLVYEEQCVQEEVPDLDACRGVVNDITAACYPKCTGDECAEADDVNTCASECFELCAKETLGEIIDEAPVLDSKVQFADGIKASECAKFHGGQHESCRNVVDGIVNFCWDGSEDGSADFACSNLEDGHKMHKCFRQCSRAYMQRLSGAEQSFLAKAPLLRRDVEGGLTFQ